MNDQADRTTTTAVGEIPTPEQASHLWMYKHRAGDVPLSDPSTVIVRGKGCYVTNADGQTFLEAMSGLYLVNIGFGREEIARAVEEQLRTLSYAACSSHAVPVVVKLAARVAALAPGDLDYVLFVNSGSEANEVALKVARQYHALRGEEKRYKFIARDRTYHGATFGAMSVSGNRMLNDGFFEPLLPETLLAPHPDCGRCALSLTYPSCGVQCAREMERIILAAGPETVAAIIGEPVSVSAGVVVPPPEYWPIVREICDRHGVLLIHDEVINGFGRTGRWFASQHWGATPDIMTVAKGITSGYMPMGAAIVSKRVGKVFTDAPRGIFHHICTFGGHPAAAAAAMANLDIIENEGIVENVAQMGPIMLERLRTLQRHRIVGDVRGIGLLFGVDLWRDDEKTQRLSLAEKERVRQLLRDHGILCRVVDEISISPPLIVREPEIEFIVNALDGALTDMERELGME